tara:strand:+ start:161 stop:376 length:216 start_codon:yes stop_codon:yes gene_type:complete
MSNSPIVKMARNSQVTIKSLNAERKQVFNKTSDPFQKSNGTAKNMMSIEGSELMQMIDQGYNEIQQYDQQV